MLKEKTIVIPGIFFDINPSHRRNLFNSICHHFVRISFGPPMEDLDRGTPPARCALHVILIVTSPGLDAIERVLRKVRKGGLKDLGHGYRKSVDLEPGMARSAVSQGETV